MTALARIGAERLWTLLYSEPYVPALGTLTGNQAVEQIQAGLKASMFRDGKSQPMEPSRARCIPIKPVSAQQRPSGGARHQRGAGARRSDPDS
jgi:hypothetical protein